MAVIECVFNYDPEKGLTQVIHVLKVDENDKINFVTQTPGLTLKCEQDFDALNLKAGDYAPVRFTPAAPGTGVPLLEVYYHPQPLKVACGELVPKTHNYKADSYESGSYIFKVWKDASGLSAPGGGPG